MEKKKNYGIQEVSKLMNLPKATIRYWDSRGLIASERNEQNDYREFSLQATLNLGNVSFLRSIGMPIKEVREILRADVSRQEEMLLDTRQSIEKKKRELEQQEVRIRKQIHALEEIRRLQGSPLAPGKPEFVRAVAFLNEKECHWRKIMEEPWVFVLAFDLSGQTYRYGIGYSEGELKGEPKGEPGGEAAVKEDAGEEEILWERREASYYNGLLLADNREEGKNNLAKMLGSLPEGMEPKGSILAQFLTSEARGREILDYYKLWVQV